jgi:hypothetical protein
LGVLGRFCGTRLAAYRAKAALARKTDCVGRATTSTAIPHKAVLFAPAAQRLSDRAARSRSDIGRYFALKKRLDPMPMIRENAVQKTRLVHPIKVTTPQEGRKLTEFARNGGPRKEKDGAATSKSALFFL